MLLGVIADDFTGASDIANTLAKGVAPDGGLRTAQFPGVPDGPADPGIEAGVISLKSRSAPVKEAIADSLAALDWLLAQGCQQIIFKYCSTFDSTPEGNIGPVAEAIMARMGATSAVACPAFPTAGRTIYQGHLFVFDRLLNDSGMQNHPLTPMTDPDIRRWLSQQVNGPVGLIPLRVVGRGPATVRQAISDHEASGGGLFIADAATDEDLLTLGEALADAKFVTGGSGIALGLPRNFIRSGLAKGGQINSTEVSGPAAILAGSCSGATRGQIDHHAQHHPTLAIDVPAVMHGVFGVDHLVAFIEKHAGQAPLCYSSGTPDEVKALQKTFGREAVSAKLDLLFADAARNLVRKGYRRIVVAGGETSGAVAQAVASELGNPAMIIGPEIDPGVPVLTLGDANPQAIALKSGNFGAPDFFAKALRVMEGPA